MSESVIPTTTLTISIDESIGRQRLFDNFDDLEEGQEIRKVSVTASFKEPTLTQLVDVINDALRGAGYNPI